MKAILAIFRKDFKTNVLTFSSFSILAVFALLTGVFFFSDVTNYQSMFLRAAAHPEIPHPDLPSFSQAVMTPLFTNAALILLFIVPVISMRLFAEEKRSGTLELLFTYPVSDFQIVAGKFLAAGAHLFLLFLPALINFIFFYRTVYPFEVPAFCAAFLGFFLIGFSFTSVGIFISSLSSSETISAILTFVTLAAWWSIGFLSHLFFGDALWIKEVWVIGHLNAFARGVIELKTVVLYVLASGFFFFLTFLSIETRSWKQSA